MARLRWHINGTEEYWTKRILGYMRGEIDPQRALKPRILFIALESGNAANPPTAIGFIAGHLTRRYDCDGELEWINVAPEYRGKGIAQALLPLLAGWFVEQGALSVCVDVDPANTIALNFYRRQGAENLNEHWLYWKDISKLIILPPAS